MAQRRRGTGRVTGRPAARDRPAGTGTAGVERVRAVAEPVVVALGYDLEELTVARAGRRDLVRVVVDADGGISLDAIAAAASEISAALDRAETTGGLAIGAYTLEVSSPGVDRPLTEPRHWRRNVDRLVRVQVGERILTGRVRAAGDLGVTLDVDGTEQEIGHAELGPGAVQLEFDRRGAGTAAGTEQDEEEDERKGRSDEH